jgi:GTPase KRas
MNENCFKMVVCGDCGVGKSSLILRYLKNSFVEEYDPTIEDEFKKLVTINNQKFLLTITGKKKFF